MTIYVVIGATGEYSDRTEWLVKAFKSEKEAQEFVIAATAIANDQYLKKRNKTMLRFKPKSELDPNLDIDYTGAWYKYDKCELVSE